MDIVAVGCGCGCLQAHLRAHGFHGGYLGIDLAPGFIDKTRTASSPARTTCARSSPKPSSLLKKDEDYAKVFSADVPINVYRVCAAIVKKVDTKLRADETIDARERNNLLFYVALHMSAVASGRSAPNAQLLAVLDVDSVTDEQITTSLQAVKELYEALGGGDSVAKGSGLVDLVKTAIADHLSALTIPTPAAHTAAV